MKLRVEYQYDPESRNWSYAVPTLGIIGGAETRQQAAYDAREAIEFTLECDDTPKPSDDADVEYVNI